MGFFFQVHLRLSPKFLATEGAQPEKGLRTLEGVHGENIAQGAPKIVYGSALTRGPRLALCVTVERQWCSPTFQLPCNYSPLREAGL